MGDIGRESGVLMVKDFARRRNSVSSDGIVVGMRKWRNGTVKYDLMKIIITREKKHEFIDK